MTPDLASLARSIAEDIVWRVGRHEAIVEVASLQPLIEAGLSAALKAQQEQIETRERELAVYKRDWQAEAARADKAEAHVLALTTALADLVAKCELIGPVVDGYIGLTHIRSGGQYTGPNWIEEMKAAKQALSAQKNPTPEAVRSASPQQEESVSDESVQVIHLRLCGRAKALSSPIAALEEAAEEIVSLTMALAEAKAKADRSQIRLHNLRSEMDALIARSRDTNER